MDRDCVVHRTLAFMIKVNAFDEMILRSCATVYFKVAVSRAGLTGIQGLFQRSPSTPCDELHPVALGIRDVHRRCFRGGAGSERNRAILVVVQAAPYLEGNRRGERCG
eukprot:CAMPEP_0204077594 /NCGR_PEP_ID=MMETSP0360-20130528/169585_1 /ASSEMBLY_ACC=CAM_ASM_000342 /TAXON_ID=268821 /ORGANISM="Scrippsiella Hangoei, Strain SHTV-5" /LENGTH=107 /DNA_ID=CAMNT_0051026223 /DNA_START=41 /DNA_END=360 /DNA_ORIENTATION=+